MIKPYAQDLSGRKHGKKTSMCFSEASSAVYAITTNTRYCQQGQNYLTVNDIIFHYCLKVHESVDRSYEIQFTQTNYGVIRKERISKYPSRKVGDPVANKCTL